VDPDRARGLRAALPLDLGKGVKRAAALVLLLAAASCQDPIQPPEVSAGGEPGNPVLRAAGRFEKISFEATGSATYTLDDNGGAALALSADFAVPAVPGTSIYLSDSGDLARAVKVGELKAARGAQRWTFTVPRGAVWTWALLWSRDLGTGVARARLGS